MTGQRYVVQPLGPRSFGVLDTRTQLTVELRFTRAAAEREATRLTASRIAAPVCRQPGCGAQTWGSCTHCTEPYCADHLAPVGEFSELVCADDLTAARPSGDR